MEDHCEVAKQTYIAPIQSIGNGITAPRDLYDLEDVRLIAYVLCESIVHRLREANLAARCISVQLRNIKLVSIQRQITVPVAITTVSHMMRVVMDLCARSYDFKTALRSITIQATQLISRHAAQQLSLFDAQEDESEEALDVVMEQIRRRFGTFSIRRCSMKQDLALTDFDPYSDHTIHPVNFFR